MYEGRWRDELREREREREREWERGQARRGRSRRAAGVEQEQQQAATSKQNQESEKKGGRSRTYIVRTYESVRSPGSQAVGRERYESTKEPVQGCVGEIIGVEVPGAFVKALARRFHRCDSHRYSILPYIYHASCCTLPPTPSSIFITNLVLEPNYLSTTYAKVTKWSLKTFNFVIRVINDALPVQSHLKVIHCANSFIKVVHEIKIWKNLIGYIF